MVNKKVKKVIAKRAVKADIPSAFDMKTGIDVGKGKKTIPTTKKTKKVNPFQTVASMNIPVPTKKVVAKKKKKAVKKPKFNYSKSFNFTKK